MEIHVTINGIASLFICVSTVILIIDIYATSSSPIYEYSLFESWAVKLGLSGTAAGSLLNLFISGSPPWSEVVLNVGLAFLFSWCVVFYRRHFKLLDFHENKPQGIPDTRK